MYKKAAQKANIFGFYRYDLCSQHSYVAKYLFSKFPHIHEIFNLKVYTMDTVKNPFYSTVHAYLKGLLYKVWLPCTNAQLI